jgi:UPF0755 protein
MGKRLFQAVLSAMILFCATGYYFLLVSQAPRIVLDVIQYGEGPEILIQVKSGENASQIAEDFSQAGIVDHAEALAVWFSRFGIDRTIRPGTYAIRKGSPWEVAKQMQRAKPETDLVTLLPGMTWHDILETYSVTSGELKAILAENSNFPKETHPFLPEKALDRLAFLLPETYQVAPGDQRLNQLIRSASSAWWKQIGRNIVDAVDTGDVEKAEAIWRAATVASLVEKESAAEEERPVIAGVIENRLRKGMPLQIDATVVYAWRLRGENLTRVLHRHLEVDSPYNTYKIKGLPPGPICVPSKESWEAALKPEETPFLFYVAGDDGKHRFSRTYKEHLKKIREIRK